MRCTACSPISAANLIWQTYAPGGNSCPSPSRPSQLKPSASATVPAWEFYDLEKDPHENHNAYKDDEYSSIIKRMKIELLKQREAVGDMDGDYPVMQDILEKYWE